MLFGFAAGQALNEKATPENLRACGALLARMHRVADAARSSAGSMGRYAGSRQRNSATRVRNGRLVAGREPDAQRTRTAAERKPRGAGATAGGILEPAHKAEAGGGPP